MNDHQKRLWQAMIDLVQDYLNGKTEDFCGVVGKLEGALDAANIKDPVLINRWYDFWTPLEIRRAVEGNNAKKEEVIHEFSVMKEFLENEQKKICRQEDNGVIDLQVDCPR
jgi:hypothetical protein